MEIKTYAPVIIPTLNRYEHFKRCLESLEHCTGAEHTDVYVALDYPPSDKYVDGWKKIDSYLHEKEISNCFKTLIVIRRNQNCGVGNEHSNGRLLTQFISKLSPTYIFTEDDNVFSPCFLEYVNWGLETYKDDDSIMFVCGFKRVNVDFLENNVYKYPKFVAWGYGTWSDKRSKYNYQRDVNYIKKWIDSLGWNIMFTDKVRVASGCLSMIKTGKFMGDILTNLIPENKRYCLFPKVSMVKNLGWDGSGTHGGNKSIDEFYKSLPIDDHDHFVPHVIQPLYDPRLKKIYGKAYHANWKIVLYRNVRFALYKLFGKYISDK